jgi:hypothetical protein
VFRPLLAVPADGPALRAAGLALLALAVRDLRARPQAPLYTSGVRYAREPGMRDTWKLPSMTAADGYGDCEDLAAWRAAELRLAGVRAAPVFLPIGRPGNWHAVVRWPNGQLEDPSAVLGMRTGARTVYRGR